MLWLKVARMKETESTSAQQASDILNLAAMLHYHAINNPTEDKTAPLPL